MTDKRPSRGSDQFPLRLPDGMRELIKEAAKRNGRSMNSEIIARLDDSFGAEVIADAAAGAEVPELLRRKSVEFLFTEISGLVETLARIAVARPTPGPPPEIWGDLSLYPKERNEAHAPEDGSENDGTGGTDRT